MPALVPRHAWKLIGSLYGARQRNEFGWIREIPLIVAGTILSLIGQGTAGIAGTNRFSPRLVCGELPPGRRFVGGT